MKLKREQGQFILNIDPRTTPPKKLFLRERWKFEGEGKYKTTDLKAAVKFREYANESAEKYFQRRLVRNYPKRKLPPLLFLDPHQREGVEWILSRSGSYLAHAPGAGKTVQVIVAAHFTKGSGKIVFIVPPNLVVNWEREIQQWLSALKDDWFVVSQVNAGEKDAPFWFGTHIIIPDSMIAKDWVYERLQEMNIKFLAVDEASRYKEPTSLRSLALFGGSNGKQKFKGLTIGPKHVVLLDGSPMLNRPIELWAPTFALNPEAIDCMTYDDFGYRYCGPTIDDRGVWQYKHSSHEEELKERLQSSFMHVVPEARLNHPERRRKIVFMPEGLIPYRVEQWSKYNINKISMRGEEDSRGDVASIRKDLGDSKIRWTAEYILDILENTSESVLVFGWHRDFCTIVHMHLKKYDPGLVIGGMNEQLRELTFERFRKRKTRVIVGNITAMGRGHNLQVADRVVFGEFSWTDENNKQAEKRASRKGRDQDKHVRCEYIAVPNSMDEVVLNSLFTKEARVKRVIG